MLATIRWLMAVMRSRAAVSRDDVAGPPELVNGSTCVPRLPDVVALLRAARTARLYMTIPLTVDSSKNMRPASIGGTMFLALLAGRG